MSGCSTRSGRSGPSTRAGTTSGPTPDGTEFIEGTGTHFWVHDRQRKFRTYGTWHLLLGPEGLLYEKYFRDRTSVWDGTVADIDRKLCQFLAPRAS
jgi:hypothetical protein